MPPLFKTVEMTAEDGTVLKVGVPTGPLPTAEKLAILASTFDRVKDKTHWKNPIDTVVDLGTTSAMLVDDFISLTTEAIEFYTATTPTFTLLDPGKIRVTAPGYYAGPAA